MKKNGISSVSSSNFVEKILNRMKNLLKKPSKITFGKIGLFLILAVAILNINIADAQALTWEQALNIIWEELTATPGRMVDQVADTGYILANPIESAFKGLLFAVLKVISILIIAAGALFDTVLNYEFLNAFLRNDGIYNGWVIVRDVLNMFFMLLLLFSAFATIFQVEKYHLRKVIIMLVVMALLVNFSFPIALFVMDFSNSAMYFFVDAMNSGSTSMSARVASFVGFGQTIENSVSLQDDLSAIILAIIFSFILFLTIIGISINLLIRVLAFAILLVLAPAGFVFAFFPDTKNIANDWWSALFKYAFMGPVMVFFIYLSVMMFDINNNVDLSKFDKSTVGSFVKYVIPVAFLWIGMIAANKFGGSGSAAAMGVASKMGNNIKGYGQKAAWGAMGGVGKYIDSKTGHVVSGTVGASKMKLNQLNDDYKSASNTRATEFADKLGVKGANEKLVQESRKKWKESGGLDDKEATRIEANGTKAEKMALALERAEEKGFSDDPVMALKQYNDGLAALAGNKVYEDIFKRNVTKKNVDLKISAEIEATEKVKGAGLNDHEISSIATAEFEKLNPGEWKDQNIERIMKLNTTMGSGEIAKSAKAITDNYATSVQGKLFSEMKGAKYATGRGELWA